MSTDYCWHFIQGHNDKLKQLGLPNKMVDDSDSKPSGFIRRFWSDSNMTMKLLSTITIFILFRSLFWLNSTIFDLFLIKLDHFLIKRLKKITIMSIKRLKKVNIYWLFYLFRSNSQILMHFWADLIDFVTTIDLDSKNSDQKFD